MRSTWQWGASPEAERRGAQRWAGLVAVALICALAIVALRPAHGAQDELFPRPAELEPAVHFWIRVYTEIDTDSGFLHDENNLSVVYETLHFSPDTSRRQRERLVEAARDRLVAALERIATASGPLSADDERVRKLWGDEATPARLIDATQHIRFQLGQSDRFREGLERSGRWEDHIAETLKRLRLPPELAVLPHVESSFNPIARSKVGAAGLWQFMRSTGRRYMRIDSTVDDRLDPFLSTEAAAQLLSYDYRLLGTWPLAITAYNHGAAGMRRAVEDLGTDDIARIVRNYKSPTFGFASRNFYASFLAVLEIDRNPEKYFGSISREPEARFQEVTLPFRASIPALERALHIDRDTLRELNPALRPICWRGGRPVPKGYSLRLPTGGTEWTAKLVAARLESSGTSPGVSEAVLASDTEPARHRARSGETLASLSVVPLPAEVAQIPRAADAAPSSFIPQNPISPSVPALQPAGGPVSPEIAELDSEQDAAADASNILPSAGLGPVSAAEEEALGPALGPAAVAGTATADPIDYSVAKDGTIVVAATETLGHYADWLGIPTWRLRRVNHLRFGRPVVMGHRIKLIFPGVTPEQFEAKRRDYHRTLEAAYFAAHHITGTETYVARRGDSLWNVTERYAHVPIWLLQQYNPDVDFSDMRPGTQISVPRVVEEVAD